jgi:hypothetical protein
MIKKITTITLLLGTLHYSFSQINKNDSTEKLYVRFNFLGLLDLSDENLSIGMEYRFRPKWSTGSDIAWIFNSSYLSTQSNSANGFMVRPFIRYYPSKNKNRFFEAELYYKFVSYKIQDWLGHDPVNGIPSYEEFTTFHYNKNVLDIHIKRGTQLSLTKDHRLRMEFIYGLGLRWKWQRVKNGIYNLSGYLGTIYDPEVKTLVIPATIRLLYKIK